MADYILYNNAPIPDDVLLKYSLEQKVELGSLNDSEDVRIISVPLALISETHQIFSDPKVIQKSIQDLIR